MKTTPQAYSLAAGEGRSLWHLDALLTFKALSAETNGLFWAFEGLADTRMAVPLHAHSREDEFWYVLEGEVAFTVHGQTKVVGAGAFLYVPRDTPHTFQVVSERARWLGVGISGQFDQWFFETGEPAAAPTLPPPASQPPDVNALVASLQAYGTETLGPPPSRPVS
jgi:mannose-6-phosphate isomerase-like protein (cupin superfamily)